MNGAESLLQTLVNCDVTTCFANPGTSEMHFVAALDAVPRMHAVLCLLEGVATGAADGYARITGRPASTLLHLGPGLANGLANLHNAKRASSPVINIIGDHALSHRQFDAPLASDIAGLARTVSAWVCETRSSRTVATDAARAVGFARSLPGHVVSVILPADAAWSEADGAALPIDTPEAPLDLARVEQCVANLRSSRKPAILLRGKALLDDALEAAGRVAAASGARLLCDTLAPRVQEGSGRVLLERLPYLSKHLSASLADIDLLVLVGATPPVSFFAYPGESGWCLPEHCQIQHLSHEHEDGTAALKAVEQGLGRPLRAVHRASLNLPPLPGGALTLDRVGQVIAHLTPEGAIFADDSVTAKGSLATWMSGARPHDNLAVSGGAIGLGIPMAAGAALGASERKVICTQGDGGAGYCAQALWTIAREKLDVTTVVFSNRSYAILKGELQRIGKATAGTRASSLLDLGSPDINWATVAQGYGVEASRAVTSEEFVSQYRSAMRTREPRLIEVVLSA